MAHDDGARYFRPRMACLAGYYDPPSIFSAMSFDLRQLPLVSSRIVILGTRKLELWAPNSLQFPFLPGAVRSNYRPVAPATLIAERRYDGHYGKHDCIHAPQYFRADAMYWPFIRRASAVPFDDAASDAFAPLTQFWSPEAKLVSSCRGSLQPAFIARLNDLGRSLDGRMEQFRRRVDSREWDRRPSADVGSAIGRLLSVRVWDDAVDQGVSLQRLLREKEAWIAWAEEIERQRMLSLEDLRSMDMMLALEEFVGVWVNGADERTTLFYMAAGVPCFIVHEYAPGATSRDEVEEVQVFKDVVTGTELERELSDSNSYQRIARLQGYRDAPYSGDDGRGRARLATAADEARSSSLHLESLPRPELLHPSRLGYYRPHLPPPGAPKKAARTAAPVPSRATSSSALAPKSSAAPATGFPGVAPQASQAAVDRYAPRPLERVTIEAGREDWIVPPPIQAAWKGPWSKWELGVWAGVTAWVGRGKKAEIDAEAIWYDRELGRRLYISDFAPPDGCVDYQRHGAPVPRYPFYFDNGGAGVAKRASSWMYRQQEPPAHDVGRKASRPDARRLPFKDVEERKLDPVTEGGSDSDSGDDDSDDEERPAGGGGISKGKGKAAETDAMDVDEMEDDASNVIVLRGVDSQVTALMFRAFAADALHAVRAAPLAIVHGQGRMWLRFESISDARRAFGALVEMNAEVEGAFAPDGAFDEAFTYSRDRWTIATMDQEGSTSEMDIDRAPPAPLERLAAAPAPGVHGTIERPAAAPSPSLPQMAGSSASSPPAVTVERLSAAPASPDPRNVERLPAAPPRVPPQPATRPSPPFPEALHPPTAPRAMRAATNAFRRLSLEERLTTPGYASTSAVRPSMAARPTRRGLEQRLSDAPPPLAQRLSDPPYPPRKKVRRGKRAGRQTREQEEMRALLREQDDYSDMEPGEVHDDYIF
ncbi:hypothetical protein B0H15DRAFT_952276 [Mycena belliarum]|uniref:Uncharacterized protein n=1 Tax=Mycena belliarum TaxID=1033014 RepID=A0AAD6U2U4_9AGAR|nr:hypothetical protein B0H15DRAFT_952276 [Mycena belliae]